MKFILEVDLDFDPAKVTAEVERILRYWGGNLRHYELVPGTGSAIYDSDYRDVGRWAVTDSPEPDTATAG